MTARLILKFDHPLATPGASFVSRALVVLTHVFMASNAFLFVSSSLSFYLPLAALCLIIEYARKNPDSRPYIKEAALRLALQFFVIIVYIGTTYADIIKQTQSLQSSFYMLMILFIFLNLYEAAEALRGRLPLRLAIKKQ